MNKSLFPTILSLAKQFMFWLMVFLLSRTVFFIYYNQLLINENIGFVQILASYWYGFKLDIATACYLISIPYFLLLFQNIYSPKWFNAINKIYTTLLLFIILLITTAELGTYDEWQTKLPYKAIRYLSHPTEMFNSTSSWRFIGLVLILSVQFVIFYYLYQKFFYSNLIHLKRKISSFFCFLLIIPPLLFIGMRGGVQQIPINQSQSYYSEHNILNIGAVNSGFSFIKSITENIKNFNKNPFQFYSTDEARKTVLDIHSVPKDTSISVLKTNRPNIVLIILESWSADLIEDLGAKPGITPQFKELEKNGILFTNIYASGSRSEQGMACIFSGFPAHPISSITVQPEKFQKLPSLIKVLKSKGYHSSYYFGGQLIYGNIKGYIMDCGFDKIKEIYDFDKKLPRGKLGIHDQYTLSQQLKDLNSEKQPFISAIFTVSTHSPFDQPMKNVITWGNELNGYLNSAYYTDKCLGDFFRNAKKQPWFDNTLFILVADHGHHSYRHWHPFSPQYHHVPLLFYGNVIKDEWEGTQWKTIGSQTDIAGTLLSQLEIDKKQFHWSKNLLSPYSPQFAYYAFEEGLGWIRPYGYFVYDKKSNNYFFMKSDVNHKDKLIKEGKSYLQTVFQEYMNY